MRIIFMGTPTFAVEALKVLVENHIHIVAVITSPDKPSGRGLRVNKSPVKEFALEKNIPVLQPTNLKDPTFINSLQNYKADLQIVVAFRMLPEMVWNMPPLGTYNLHASLLPKYRGAAPINWAIINGETETGITTFKLTHAIDSGLILYQESVKINTNVNATQLHDELMVKGAQLMLKSIVDIGLNKITLANQLEVNVTHAPKLNKINCKINWALPVTHIYNHIRGLSNYPAAYSLLQVDINSMCLVKVFNSYIEHSEHTLQYGSIFSDYKTYLKVVCQNGFIYLTDIQMENKKRMLISEFLKGFKINATMRFIIE